MSIDFPWWKEKGKSFGRLGANHHVPDCVLTLAFQVHDQEVSSFSSPVLLFLFLHVTPSISAVTSGQVLAPGSCPSYGSTHVSLAHQSSVDPLSSNFSFIIIATNIVLFLFSCSTWCSTEFHINLLFDFFFPFSLSATGYILFEERVHPPLIHCVSAYSIAYNLAVFSWGKSMLCWSLILRVLKAKMTFWNLNFNNCQLLV